MAYQNYVTLWVVVIDVAITRSIVGVTTIINIITVAVRPHLVPVPVLNWLNMMVFSVLPQCRFGVKHDKHHHNSSSSTLSSSVSSTASKNEQILVGRKKCGKIVRLRRRVNELAC